MPRRATLRNSNLMQALGLTLCLSGPIGISAAADAQPAPPRVEANGGLEFQSQGEGAPNSFSGYLFAPLSQGARGEVLFLDVAASLNLGGALAQQNNVSAGASTRLGYRWLSSDQRWMYGVNGGIDTRQAYAQYAFQAGVGVEALSRNVELRANGYIPFANQSEIAGTGWTNAALANNRLILDGWSSSVVSLGGVNLEAGLPVARWNQDSLWLYGAYYYLDGDLVNGSSGVRGRAEMRLGNQLSVGATLSYDSIFQLQATGYLRYGAKPLAADAGASIDAAERNFLAQRGLPMQRETNIRMTNVMQSFPGSIATNASNGGSPWVVRCTGATASAFAVTCANASLDGMLLAAGPSDVLLVGGGATSSSDLQGATLQLPVGTALSAAGSAPIIGTQFGNADLSTIFGNAVGPSPTISNGVISIGSNTTVSGFAFNNASITNYSTSNVVIANNTFVGSFTDNPTDLATARAFGAINVSANALPAIQLENVDNLTISGNTFLYPQVQTYPSQEGSDNGSTEFVCNQNGANTSGLCLSGNAIRLNNVANAVIASNTVIGALDEAFRINNPSGTLAIISNAISEMRMGPDSNIGSAIIIGQNQGVADISVLNNSISSNSIGIYPVVTSATQNNVPRAAAGTDEAENVIDPFEIGLCRGTDSYPRYQDLYASSSFSGNCASAATMNLLVSGTTINLPKLADGYLQQGDGIDFNVGTNGVLNATVEGNVIQTLGDPASDDGNIGDNGLTFDFRGSSSNRLTIRNNTINNSGDAAIGFSLQNTNLIAQPGETRITITANTYGEAAAINRSLEIDLVKNAGLPVSDFFVTNTDPEINVRIRQQTFNPETQNYPNLYYNGTLWQQP